jgi:SAM-dependent methyltransferase
MLRPHPFAPTMLTMLTMVTMVSMTGCGGSEPAHPVQAQPQETSRTAYIAYGDARPILDAFHAALPAALAGKTPQELETAWPAWTAAHDAAIRARLARGDEDSVVNFWLYGTSFTARPRATAEQLAHLRRQQIEDLLIGRLDDLIDGMAAPRANERLAFARQVVERQGIDLTTDQGKDKAREYLVGVRERVIAETARHRREADAARGTRGGDGALDTYAAIYRDRGLSSDTSLPVDFAVDRALAAFASADRSRAGRVSRVAVIGPGLDFTDKAEGIDTYPPQTIQPFALIDSLVRLGLAKPGDVRVTAFDLTPRVIAHVRAAAERARAGAPYDLQLPLARHDPAHDWEAALLAYWKGFGTAIGQEIPPVGGPADGPVEMRAVRVRPDVVSALSAEDLNVVVQRREHDEPYDVVLATNVLVYYDAFEQALALANIAAMLRPGGVFVTNYLVHPNPPLEPTARVVTPVYWDRQRNGDTIFVYQRR